MRARETPAGRAGPGARAIELDVVRGIAILLVVTFHVGERTSVGASPSTMLEFVGRMHVGLPLFFALSGFLLYRPFARAHAGTGEAPTVFMFAVRRVARIYPAYLLVLGVTALWIGVPRTFDTPGHAVQQLSLVRNFTADGYFAGLGHAWSVGVELQFYALLPLYALAVAWCVRRRGGGACGPNSWASQR